LAAVAKARTRKGGSAVPLDDADRHLLNLLQGSFPLAERPYAEIARLAGLTEHEVLRRTNRLLRDRIIREVTTSRCWWRQRSIRGSRGAPPRS
jgi:hypothetical protein